MKILGMASTYGFEGTRSWPTALFQRLKRRVGTMCDNNGWTAGDTSRPKLCTRMFCKRYRYNNLCATSQRFRRHTEKDNGESEPRTSYIFQNPEMTGLVPLRHLIRIDQTTVANKMFENLGGWGGGWGA
jgi:hypothetical protein